MALPSWPSRIFSPCVTSREVAHAKRRPGLRRQERLLDVLDVAEQPERADVHLLQAALDEVAAAVDVVRGELVLDLAERQAVRDQLVGIDAHLILARRAAEGADVDDVGDRLELP